MRMAGKAAWEEKLCLQHGALQGGNSISAASQHLRHWVVKSQFGAVLLAAGQAATVLEGAGHPPAARTCC